MTGLALTEERHSEPGCEISVTASYKYSWSFTSFCPNISRFGFVSVPISLFIPYNGRTLWTDCRWLRIGIHLNLHPYQQRLDRISFVYSDLSGHMVMVVVVGECFPLTVIRTKYQLAGLSDCLHQPAGSSVQK